MCVPIKAHLVHFAVWGLRVQQCPLSLASSLYASILGKDLGRQHLLLRMCLAACGPAAQSFGGKQGT